MTTRKYPGYPQYVIITLPKCGTKSMNKCFSTLGFKGTDLTIQDKNYSLGSRALASPFSIKLLFSIGKSEIFGSSVTEKRPKIFFGNISEITSVTDSAL